MFADASNDDGVLTKSEAADALVGAVGRHSIERLMWPLRIDQTAALINTGDGTTRTRLDQTQHHGAVTFAYGQRIDIIFFVGIQSAENQIGSKTIHRQGWGPLLLHTKIEIVE